MGVLRPLCQQAKHQFQPDGEESLAAPEAARGVVGRLAEKEHAGHEKVPRQEWQFPRPRCVPQ
eukprot:3299432-Lingulodinium_polyedra.AAC.1